MPAYRYQQGDRPLDGYTIQHALGRGGFGEVYFAISDAGREVALKAIQNYEEIELRGVGHCMNLKSSQLVMIFDVRQDTEGAAWVIMEYVSGASLREILDESPEGVGVDQAGFFLRELCKGLTYLHDAGVVHRDLKPHNVFFEDGVVKIGDYSLSKAITTSHRSGHTTTVGSVHYMAPEISAGRYGKTVDIYALGVMLFEMLTGTPPYTGESMGEVLMKHLSSQPDVSGLPKPFDRVVAKAMARDPDQRYQTASEMMRALSTEDELEFSRPPASLSMIGDRAVQVRTNRVRASETSTRGTKAALVDTPVTPGVPRDSLEKSNSMPFERPRTVNIDALGLWWKRQPNLALTEDSVPIASRLAIAVIACLLLIPVVGGIRLSILVAAYSALTCWFLLSTLPRVDGPGSAMVTRLIATVPWAVVLGALVAVEDLQNYVSVVMGVMVVHLVIDARCLVSADRYPRIGLAKTLLAGGIAAVTTTLFDEHDGNNLIAAVIAVSSTIVIQVLAPFGRAETDRSRRVTAGQEDVFQQQESGTSVTDQPMVPPTSLSPSVTNQRG